MEPFPKRQRLFAPVHLGFARSFSDQHGYYDATPDSEMVEDEDEDEGDDGEDGHIVGEDAVVGTDPDEELEQRRAQLDHKLKSTFEAIFEKYGKDFDGIGDEIDLATGEILVDNGHLAEMQDERDAGDLSKRVLGAFTDEPEDTADSSMGETEIPDVDDDEDEDEDEDEDGNDEEDSTSEDDMVDDDMILRGFAKANRFVQASSQELETLTEPPHQELRYGDDHLPSVKRNSLPSRSGILTQFGPQLGQQIVEYLSQQQVLDQPVADESHIEPAWRVPKITSSRSGKPSSKPLNVLPLPPKRSPSPEASTSIWAPAGSRGRRSFVRVANEVESKGKGRIPEKQRDVPAVDLLSAPAGFSYDHVPESAPKRIRKNFTPQDDQILLDFVAQARCQNLRLWSMNTWQKLGDMHPHHSAGSWRARWWRKYTYLWPNEADEPESSAASVDTTRRTNVINSEVGRLNVAHAPTQPHLRDRPSRVRKPAEKDTRIMSWSQAVDAIEMVDPDLHADMLEDIRIMERGKATGRKVSSSFGQDAGIVRPVSAHSARPDLHNPILRSRNDRIPNSRHPGEISSDFMVVNHPSNTDQALIPCAPCPHADCTKFPSDVYRLQRRDEEDLSEMCLHLFHQHHTTPFPCGEINCTRKGQDGYFMQADLVRHVRTCHPNDDALQGLQGRVASEFLDQPIEMSQRSENEGSPKRPGSRRVDSDFMSPSQIQSSKISSSVAQFSSSSGAARTLTPRMMSGTVGASESTPMTSISSMMVHPSSIAEMGQSQSGGSRERLGSVHTKDSSFEVLQLDPAVTVNNSSRSTITPARVLGTRELSDPFRRHSSHQSFSTPQVSLSGPPGPSSAFAASNVSTRPEARMSRPKTADRMVSEPKAASSGSILNSQITGSALASSSLNASLKPVTAQVGDTAGLFFQTTLDPAYEFSDEDTADIPRPKGQTTKLPPPTNSIGSEAKGTVAIKTITSSIPTKPPHASLPLNDLPGVLTKPNQNTKESPLPTPTNIVGKPKAVPATPASKLSRKTVIADSDDDDFDELSLNADDFILLSRPRTNPQPRLLSTGKKRIIAKTPLLRSNPVPKRKLDVFLESTNQAQPLQNMPKSEEIDSLNPSIKTEADDSNTLPEPLKNSHTNKHHLPTQSLPSSEYRSARTGTPLLDLTPSRQKAQRSEIVDSAGESEVDSSPPPGSQGTRTQTHMQTPVPNKRWDKAPLVIRTPGGTFRKCGEDGFRCQKDFCFTCRAESVGNGKGKGKARAL